MVRMVPARPATALHRLELLRIPGMKLLAHNNTFFTFSHLLLGNQGVFYYCFLTIQTRLEGGGGDLTILLIEVFTDI